MTLDQARQYDGQVVDVRTGGGTYGGTATFSGRFEVLDDTTAQVVGQPNLGGLPLGDAAPYKVLIEQIIEITPATR